MCRHNVRKGRALGKAQHGSAWHVCGVVACCPAPSCPLQVSSTLTNQEALGVKAKWTCAWKSTFWASPTCSFNLGSSGHAVCCPWEPSPAPYWLRMHGRCAAGPLASTPALVTGAFTPGGASCWAPCPQPPHTSCCRTPPAAPHRPLPHPFSLFHTPSPPHPSHCLTPLAATPLPLPHASRCAVSHLFPATEAAGGPPGHAPLHLCLW